MNRDEVIQDDAEDRISATRRHLEEVVELVIWMSGSPSFGPDGEAYEGWVNHREKLLAALKFLDKPSQSQPTPDYTDQLVRGLIAWARLALQEMPRHLGDEYDLFYDAMYGLRVALYRLDHANANEDR